MELSAETLKIVGAGKARMMRRATHASVGVAIVLIAIKIAAWIATGSVAMLTTLADSVLDLVASVVNLFAVRHALEPADEEHRFGHGKAEALAGLGQAILIAGSALFLLFEGIERLISPAPVAQSGFGIGVIAISIALTLLLVTYQRHVARATGSLAISADSVHYQSDLMMNLGVILSLILAGQLGMPLADPLIAIVIALFIGYSAWEIVSQSYDQLMDRELSDEERDEIRRVAEAHPEVHEIHDLRTRASGAGKFIQFHLELDPEMRLLDAHRISDEVEARVMAAFPDAEVFIHQDPAGHEDNPALALS